ncbi:DUF7126 family protein [Natrarchaeobaculum sulfurireducens]|uniref:TrkA, K+ transport system, NAD-binding component n=1 Tax=Natrarchaeobaculum sulfurireducens TaxID=2044521 RepID=A0A346PIB9_9EURY|nr:CTP synthetase [Natrarchaeobaculum sulfurireducens]AXR79264.1 TrkA, K+ transport system, NAD-binding component [Natrarchaeobaculum sulfurireducens]AXR80659.1 hypothetical protein AArcMg_0636 [Natrarchaeobaculum sulfurireducens]
MEAIVAGPDEDDLATALEAEGVSVTRVGGIPTRPTLEEAGALEADLFVLTDVDEATAIPIVCDLNDGIRTVVYARRTVPEFVKGQLDLAVDPRLVDADAVADALVS